jgi:hypothetical protein
MAVGARPSDSSKVAVDLGSLKQATSPMCSRRLVISVPASNRGKLRPEAVLLKISKRELQKWLFNRKEALFTPCHRSFRRCVACMRQLLPAVRPYRPKRRDGLTSCLFSPLGGGPTSLDPRLERWGRLISIPSALKFLPPLFTCLRRRCHMRDIAE